MENGKEIRILVLNILKEGRIEIDEADKILNYISQNENKDNKNQFPNSENISDFAKEGVSKIEKFVSGFGFNLEKVAQTINQKISKYEAQTKSNQGSQVGDKFTFNDEEIIPFDTSIEKIILENNWGSIKIIGEETENIKLSIEKIIWTKNQDLANERNLALKINRNQNNKSMQILLPQHNKEVEDTINIELRVPKNISFDLSTLSGDILIDNIDHLTGDIYVKNTSGNSQIKNLKVKKIEIISVSGDISIEQVDSQLNVRTNSGKIEIDATANFESRFNTISGDIRGQISINDSVEISSSSGNIDLKQHKNNNGKLLELMSHSGNIHYNGLVHNHLKVRTNSGNIKGHGIVANNGNMEVTSNSGDISWSVDEDCSLTFKCENKTGDIFTNLLPEEVTKSQNEANGKIKDGLASLLINTVSGDLKFHKENIA